MNARLLPLVLAVALFMENMDATVIATSLAAIAKDIGAEPIALKLALTAYLVALAIFIPISGWMADRFGARNVFRGAMLVFMAGSIACAMSNSLFTFVLARFLQGIGGSMMTPVSRLVLVRTTPRNELVGAMAWLTIPALIGPIVGPPFGGFLTTFLSWHWIFLINVPIGLVGLWLVTAFLPDWQRNKPRPVDGPGFVYAGLAFAGVVFGASVISLPALPLWSGFLAVAVGVAFGAIYVRHMRRTEYPLLELRLLRHPYFRSTVVAGAFFRIGFGATPFLFPLMLQLVFGLSPFASGLITFATAVGALAAKFCAEWLLERFGFRTNLAAATLVSTLGVFAYVFFSPTTPVPVILAVLVVTGFAQSVFWTAVSAFSFADINDRDASQANVIAQVTGQAMWALGVALGGGALQTSELLRGGPADITDFRIAFIAVGLVCAISTVLFLRLPRHAGSNISGHGVAKAGMQAGE
jgi:EmrB/QacA subfamily drug resistance transporter